MKIKLDENIGARGIELLREHGHDVRTVRDQRMSGAKDAALFAACAAEGRPSSRSTATLAKSSAFHRKKARGS